MTSGPPISLNEGIMNGLEDANLIIAVLTHEQEIVGATIALIVSKPESSQI